MDRKREKLLKYVEHVNIFDIFYFFFGIIGSSPFPRYNTFSQYIREKRKGRRAKCMYKNPIHIRNEWIHRRQNKTFRMFIKNMQKKKSLSLLLR